MEHSFPYTLREATAPLLGNVIGACPVTAYGYTAAERWIVTLAGGTSRFVKWATDDDTGLALTQERLIYEAMGPVDFVPRYFGGGDATNRTGRAYPFIMLEDLSGCQWLPPWSPEAVQAVQAVLREVHAVRENWVEALPAVELRDNLDNDWLTIADDPGPLLSLEICSADWLKLALPALHQASEEQPFAGDDLLHNDVRSDCVQTGARA